MKEHLFEAYFVQGQDLTDQKVINELFEKAGHHYDVNEAETGQLDALLAENRVLGISAVPTFVLNHDINITGAQPVDRWVNYLTKTLIKPSKI